MSAASRTPEEIARRLRELEAELRPSALQHHGPFVYVALGASDAVGVGSTMPESGYVPLVAARVRSRLGEVSLHNLGISGATLPEIVQYELPRVAALRPHLVTLMTGGNDVVQSVDTTDFRDALGLTLDRLLRLTNRVVVATVPNISVLPIIDTLPGLLLPFGDLRGYVANRCRELGRVVVEEASRRGARLVHITTSDVLADATLVSSDGFHPSDAGYRRLADRFWEQIEPMLPM
jgi:lysophospholipase L1-like esterase